MRALGINGRMSAVVLRHARPDELAALTALARRSKAHWGYSEAFMDACREALTVEPQLLLDGEVVLAQGPEGPLGFYALGWLDERDVELDLLFIEPAAIGQGIGRRLVEHAKQAARARGRRRMIVQGDPHAEGFYRAMGGERAGERASASIQDRMLPVFVIDLT